MRTCCRNGGGSFKLFETLKDSAKVSPCRSWAVQKKDSSTATKPKPIGDARNSKRGRALCCTGLRLTRGIAGPRTAHLRQKRKRKTSRKRSCCGSRNQIRKPGYPYPT